MNIQSLLKRIDENKALIDKRRPLTPEEIKNLVLINRGYQIVSIPLILRRDYIVAIEAARSAKDPAGERFAGFIAECEIEAQKDFCRMHHIKLPKKDDIAI